MIFYKNKEKLKINILVLLFALILILYNTAKIGNQIIASPLKENMKSAYSNDIHSDMNSISNIVTIPEANVISQRVANDDNLKFTETNEMKYLKERTFLIDDITFETTGFYLNQGDYVEVVGKNETFFKIKYNGLTYLLNKKSLVNDVSEIQTKNINTTVYCVEGTFLYNEPNINSTKTMVATINDKFEVKQETENFYIYESNGENHYIEKSKTSFEAKQTLDFENPKLEFENKG